MANTLSGTTVLVTGGAGGLGKAIATAYLDAGANVAICDINEERLAATRAELDGTGRFLAAKTDVTDEDAVTQLVADVVARFGGRLDILVSNAGMTDKFDPVGELSKAHWDKIIGLNLTGSFLATKAAVNAMLRQEPSGGTILQICSTSSYHGMSSGVAYTVSKHGVAGLVKNTAGNYEHRGIFAIGLMIGGMPETNIQDGFAALGGFNQDAYQLSVSSKFTQPQDFVRTRDVAKYCLFLADRDVAASSTGALVQFNGNRPNN